jgi:hypothetical protein
MNAHFCDSHHSNKSEVAASVLSVVDRTSHLGRRAIDHPALPSRPLTSWRKAGFRGLMASDGTLTKTGIFERAKAMRESIHQQVERASLSAKARRT